MSATVYYEPYKLPAGILALVVHSVFFALLYFGFNWNRQVFSPASATMSAELWASLPEQVVSPPPVNPRVEEVVMPPLPEKIIEPDIAMPEKKKLEQKKTKPKKPIPKAVAGTRHKPDTRVEQARIADQQAAHEQATREASDRAEQDAAKEGVKAEYKAKIVAKIHRNIVMPPDVANDARAEFLVTVLPGGAVLPPKLLKSSGNAAYDNAVERAILKSDPLPLPPDVALFGAFREIRMTFKPEKPAE